MTQAIGTKQDGTPENIEYLDKADLTKAKEFWSNQKQDAPKRREGWQHIGAVMLTFKAEHLQRTGKNISNNAFGDWRNEHFPGMEPALASHCMKYAENHLAINRWAEAHAPELAHPKHLVMRFNQSVKGDSGSAKKGPRTTTANNTEPEVNFESLSKDGKAKINKIGENLCTGVQQAIDLLKAGHKLSAGMKAKLNNRIEQLVILLDK